MNKKSYIVGVIGHRELGDFDNHEYAHLAIHKILSEFKRAYKEVRAVSALSEGADSLFAKSAILLNIQLESVIPFEGFSDDFQSEESQARYLSMKFSSDKESRVRFQKRSKAAYRKSMEWVVFKSNTVIALWDGNKVGTTGGTWEAVKLCMKLKKNTIHINTSNKETNLYAYKGNEYSLIDNLNTNSVLRYL